MTLIPLKHSWNVLQGYQIFKNNLDKNLRIKIYMIYIRTVVL